VAGVLAAKYVAVRAGNASRLLRPYLQGAFYGGYTDEEFQASFRLDKETFGHVVDRLDSIIVTDEKMAWVGSAGGPINNTSRLAVTLRFFAGGSIHDIRRQYGDMGRSTFYFIVWQVTEALNKTIVPEQIYFPYNDPAQLETIAEGYRRRGKNISPFQHCVGALDGLIVRIQRPPSKGKNRCRNSQGFYTRKKIFGYNLQAMCDSDYRFTFGSAQCAGSSHDSTAFYVTPLYQKITKGKLPFPYYIVADDAYEHSNSLLTPIPGRGLTPSDDAYNYWLSSSRTHIEQVRHRLK
jgi:hypothetical protein